MVIESPSSSSSYKILGHSGTGDRAAAAAAQARLRRGGEGGPEGGAARRHRGKARAAVADIARRGLRAARVAAAATPEAAGDVWLEARSSHHPGCYEISW